MVVRADVETPGWAVDDIEAAGQCALTFAEAGHERSTHPVRAARVVVEGECPVCGSEHVGRLFKAPKSRKGRRWVPLVKAAQEALARHPYAQREEREFLGIDYNDHGLVFCRPDGLPLRPDRVTVAFEAHVAACGLPMIRLHDTRHERARYCWRAECRSRSCK
ncbi:hypothetical protein [Catenuloplanes atrovinosus]|uniref:Integrase n=1 Tax=Catenuloplanes atrovinosus TaxID=137266 RepID=A0AAE3YXI6_9ACTN|nr:hypothetical protein [Catenuloplanes atrovinosus]MDR7280233.1 integrase [Catenuloplanes atrovinosus]